jgi:hypothetical protein
MTHLRKMMLEELQRRNYSENTIRCYIRTVEEDFSRRFLGGQFKSSQLGVISKPANGSGPELLEVVPDRGLSKQGKSGLFLQSSKKIAFRSPQPRFSKSPMVLAMAFPALRGRSVTWSSSSVVHI